MDIKGLQEMYKKLSINPQAVEFGRGVEVGLKEWFEGIDAITEYNQIGVIKEIQGNRISDIHFAATTGYGYDDLGRDTLEDVYASVFHGESALVRSQLTSGTHALHVALSSSLRPGDELLSPVGKPYDTLKEVIGIRDSVGSLKEYGVTYRQVGLLKDGSFDFAGTAKAMNPRTKLVTIQCSKGYAIRPTLSVDRIDELISFIKEIRPDVVYIVDNCYGEFAGEGEPTDVGAGMIVGSLIKSPGRDPVPIGGYIVETKEYVDRTSYRLNTPGLGKEVGASLEINQQLYQGPSLSPTVVTGALEGAIFTANIYERLGLQVVPDNNKSHHDIIQAITFGTPESIIAFCKGTQAATPVDSYIMPEPWDMSGYDSQVIMAAGAFVQGSSIELSTDDLVKPSYTVYFQGGLT